MDILLNTKGEEQAIKLVVHSMDAVKLQMEVFNPDMQNTYYTKRFKTIKGSHYDIDKPTFMIRLPQVSERAILRIYNTARGNMKDHEDSSFRVVEIKKTRLPKKLNVFNSNNRNVKSFIQFAQEFSENAGVLSCGTYFSDDAMYRIDYMPVIRDEKNGRELSTPLRISILSGRIEVAQKRFVNYTVPMRMMILLHEYAHFYLNKDNRNEFEADFNALLIYLGMGYPRIEAHEAWLEVFEKSPTEGNKERYEKIEEFIRNFEKANFKMAYEE